MHLLRHLAASAVLWSVLSSQVAMAQDGVDPQLIATTMVARLNLRAGERVLLVAVPGRSDALIPELRERIRSAGATDLGALASRGVADPAWATEFTRGAPATREELAKWLATVDVAIMMPGATVTDAAYAAMQDVLRTGKGRTIHFHWEGAYSIDGSPIDITPAIAAMYSAVLRDTDYRGLAAAQSAFERAVRAAPVRVTTPAGTDITFRIGDRPVTKQDGDASAAHMRSARNLIDREIELPAGAIRTAPIEESVNGRIAFPPSVWGRERVEGLVMTFVNGRVTEWSTRTGRQAVEAELSQAGPGGRAFRELALGFNPLLAIPTSGDRWIPYYGYGAGVVRLSLGDNTELGGTVGGGYVRWNFFIDATVTIGDRTWVQDGHLVGGSR